MKGKRPTTITPFLVVQGGGKAIEFYKNAFAAEVLKRYDLPNGKVTSQMVIEGAEFWLGDEEPQFDNLSPETLGGSAVRIVLVVSNPDAVFTRALEAGATQICPVTTEQFWKIGKLADPFGHIWEVGHPLD